LYAATVMGAFGNILADRVLGQPDFIHNSPNQGTGAAAGETLYFPNGVAIDSSVTPNNLYVYVADKNNNRVLGWMNADSFTSGSAADLVIGQPSFTANNCNNSGGPTNSLLCFPTSLAVDASGNLYVADAANNRVLEYSNPFAACKGTFPCVGGAAQEVFGQTSFTGSNAAAGKNGLNNPQGVALDASGDLYVADYGNNRVLEYNTPLTNATADLVFGQALSFTTGGCDSDNDGFADDPNDLCGPAGVAVDTLGNLYVADANNNGCWNTIPRSMRRAAKAAQATRPPITSSARTGTRTPRPPMTAGSAPAVSTSHQESRWTVWATSTSPTA